MTITDPETPQQGQPDPVGEVRPNAHVAAVQIGYSETSSRGRESLPTSDPVTEDEGEQTDEPNRSLQRTMLVFAVASVLLGFAGVLVTMAQGQGEDPDPGLVVDSDRSVATEEGTVVDEGDTDVTASDSESIVIINRVDGDVKVGGDVTDEVAGDEVAAGGDVTDEVAGDEVAAGGDVTDEVAGDEVAKVCRFDPRAIPSEPQGRTHLADRGESCSQISFVVYDRSDGVEPPSHPFDIDFCEIQGPVSEGHRQYPDFADRTDDFFSAAVVEFHAVDGSIVEVTPGPNKTYAPLVGVDEVVITVQPDLTEISSEFWFWCRALGTDELQFDFYLEPARR